MVFWFFSADRQSGYSDDDTFSLLYGVFAARASSIRSALNVAEQHFRDITEFQLMAADCQQAYFKIRYQMLEPVIRSTIEELRRLFLSIFFKHFAKRIINDNPIKYFAFAVKLFEYLLLNFRKLTFSIVLIFNFMQNSWKQLVCIDSKWLCFPTSALRWWISTVQAVLYSWWWV